MQSPGWTGVYFNVVVQCLCLISHSLIVTTLLNNEEKAEIEIVEAPWNGFDIAM